MKMTSPAPSSPRPSPNRSSQKPFSSPAPTPSASPFPSSPRPTPSTGVKEKVEGDYEQGAPKETWNCIERRILIVLSIRYDNPITVLLISIYWKPNWKPGDYYKSCIKCIQKNILLLPRVGRSFDHVSMNWKSKYIFLLIDLIKPGD